MGASKLTTLSASLARQTMVFEQAAPVEHCRKPTVLRERRGSNPCNCLWQGAGLGYRPGMGFDPYRGEARGLLSTSIVTAAVVVVGFVLVALLRPYLGSVGSFATALGIALVAELVLWLVIRRRRSTSR